MLSTTYVHTEDYVHTELYTQLEAILPDKYKIFLSLQKVLSASPGLKARGKDLGVI